MIQSISTAGPCTVPNRVPTSPTHGPTLEPSTQAHLHPTPETRPALEPSTQAHLHPPPETHNPPSPTHSFTNTDLEKSPTREPISNLTPENPAHNEALSTLKPTAPPLPPTHPMTTRSQNQIIKPKIPTDGTVRYPVSKALLTVTESSSIDAEPTCFTLAVKSPAWRATMNLEFDALLKNQTWQLVPPHSSQNLIGCKWVFRTEKES
uniref:Reverse transcriptase Ty1/copia-type domain-containing protein n=1 Tax=Fagus sylvatica TaxID=28930 RepID=A0A2N9I2M5_FAGSY